MTKEGQAIEEKLEEIAKRIDNLAISRAYRKLWSDMK